MLSLRFNLFPLGHSFNVVIVVVVVVLLVEVIVVGLGIGVKASWLSQSVLFKR